MEKTNCIGELSFYHESLELWNCDQGTCGINKVGGFCCRSRLHWWLVGLCHRLT